FEPGSGKVGRFAVFQLCPGFFGQESGAAQTVGGGDERDRDIIRQRSSQRVLSLVINLTGQGSRAVNAGEQAVPGHQLRVAPAAPTAFFPLVAANADAPAPDADCDDEAAL